LSVKGRALRFKMETKARGLVDAWRVMTVSKRCKFHDELPVNIRGIVNEIYLERYNRFHRHSLKPVGAGMVIWGVVSKTPAFITTGGKLFFGVGGGYRPTVSKIRSLGDCYLRLNEAIVKSSDPKIMEFREKYPFFKIDINGNLIFTTQNRIMGIGRMRGKAREARERATTWRIIPARFGLAHRILPFSIK